MKKDARVVVIGGGTGTFATLSALKGRVGHLSAIVNMVDDGGSTGVLRDELGVLPPGDVRQCLVALASDTSHMRKLMNYRFTGGTFEGHPFGNLFLSVLEKTTGSFADAVKTAGEILAIEGEVIPVTTDDIRLCRRQADGTVIKGERTIQDSFFERGENAEIYLEPEAVLNEEAARAIKEADLIVFGPGNVYCSLVPNLLVGGMPEALKAAAGKRVFICNLVNKPHQTAGSKVHEHVERLERHAVPGLFDYVLYDSSRPSEELLARYRQAGEEWVEHDPAAFKDKPYRAIGADLLSTAPPERKSGGPKRTAVTRNFIRHDPEKLAAVVMRELLADRDA
ncbi:MAG: YvcK family protein [bacterium]|nr:YvcK family protein [bacterium]